MSNCKEHSYHIASSFVPNHNALVQRAKRRFDDVGRSISPHSLGSGMDVVGMVGTVVAVVVVADLVGVTH
jgi:hypothetical protein